MNIDEFIIQNNLPPFRKKQLIQAIYTDRIASWEELTTWSKILREEISKTIPFSTLRLDSSINSKDKRTTKALFLTKESYPVESVLMRNTYRNTVCVSCMSGCPVGCKFCATGNMGFCKNLSVEEIMDQIMYFRRLLKKDQTDVTNIVYMGMGEPMLNLENVKNSINILTKDIGISHRKITVSTSGYIAELKRFLDLNLGVKIAISLHASNQQTREKIMPTVARNNSLEDLIKLLISYQKRTNKRVTYEYLLLKGVNDSPMDAKELAKLLKNQIALVNLIRFNSSKDIPFKATDKRGVDIFKSVLSERGITTTLRYSHGGDINAACGQLAKSG